MGHDQILGPQERSAARLCHFAVFHLDDERMASAQVEFMSIYSECATCIGRPAYIGNDTELKGNDTVRPCAKDSQDSAGSGTRRAPVRLGKRMNHTVNYTGSQHQLGT